jgi:HK97 family phage prohead protease
MDLKYVTGPITKADAGGLEAVISTPKVDKDAESVDPMGLANREEWLTNPLVYWAHEWAFNPSAEPIGKGTRLDVTAQAITSAAVYAPTPKAQNVRALVTGGFVRKTSVGFDSLEMAEIRGIPTHTRWSLREWSVVPMPANTDATITGVKSALRWLADEIAEPVDETEPNVLTVKLDAAELLAAIDHLSDLSLASMGASVAVMDGKQRIAVIRRKRVAVLS